MSLHVEAFSDKVRTMNQTNSKNLTLSAAEARNLHTEIFTLLSKIAEIGMVKESFVQPSTYELDGGSFNP
jgi:hypothetical protein